MERGVYWLNRMSRTCPILYLAGLQSRRTWKSRLRCLSTRNCRTSACTGDLPFSVLFGAPARHHGAMAAPGSGRAAKGAVPRAVRCKVSDAKELRGAPSLGVVSRADHQRQSHRNPLVRILSLQSSLLHSRSPSGSIRSGGLLQRCSTASASWCASSPAHGSIWSNR